MFSLWILQHDGWFWRGNHLTQADALASAHRHNPGTVYAVWRRAQIVADGVVRPA